MCCYSRPYHKATPPSNKIESREDFIKDMELHPGSHLPKILKRRMMLRR